MTPGQQLISVSFNGADTPLIGAPRPLFRVASRVLDYDVSKDGERFLIVHDAEASQPPIHVVVNWPAGISR